MDHRQNFSFHPVNQLFLHQKCHKLINFFNFCRRKFPITVNCWFCNKYEKLAYETRNSFICSRCEQYNGFLQDGDYNRKIPEMYYTKLNPITNCVFSEENVYALKKTNGLCYNCNRNQELMILQLASFVPENEENFDEEVEQYRQNLEKSYRLCAHCERVVKRSLNQVKSHIVGSKMSKLGEKLHNIANNVPPAKKMRMIEIGIYSIFAITVINFYTSLSEFSISSEKLIKTFGADIAERLFIGISYVLAVKSLIMEFVWQTLDNPFLQGAWLYLTTRLGFLQKLTGDFDWTRFSLLDVKEFLNISTMLATVMLIILSEGQNLSSQLALLFFCSLKTLLHNHEMLLEPIETEFIHTMDLICVFMALILSYRCLGQTKVTFKHSDDLNKSFHKICPEEVEEESDQELDNTYSDSCSNLLNSTLKSHGHEYVNGKNASFYTENRFNGYSRTPSVMSASFKSPSELNCSRLSSKQVMDNVGKLTQLNINHTLNSTTRSFSTATDNPFYNHLNLDRPSSVLSYRAHAIISPPKLNREPVSEASWVAGGFWTTSPKKSTLPANSDFMPIMSRTSSQSSGFESQPGANSRENSVEKSTDPQLNINNAIRPIRPHPIYPGQDRPFTNSFLKTQTPDDPFTKPLSRMDNPVLSASRASLASRQSNRSIFGEPSFNDTSSLYSYRSNGRFITPTSPNNTFNSSRSIFNFKKFSTDLPHL